MPCERGGPLAAVTGATGFLGPWIARALAERGARLRILVRREPSGPPWDALEPEIVPGDLGDPGALRRLAAGADVVVHAAGLVKAVAPDAFSRVNRDGARRLAEAVRDAAPRARFVLVSSLAAREPQLSPYAASKRAAEDEVRAVLGADVVIARPTAVYGPGDVEWTPVFRAASGPAAPMFGGPAARLSLIHAADAAAGVAELALGPARPGVWVLTDERPEGYGWREVLETAAQAAGRAPPRLIQGPPWLLHAVAGVSSRLARLRRTPAMLTPGKAREILHSQWGVADHERPNGLPPPRFTLKEGFRDTLAER